MKRYLFVFLLMLLLVAGATDIATAQIEVKKCKTCDDAIAACPYNGKHPKPVKKRETCGNPVDKGHHKVNNPSKCKSCGKPVDKCPYNGKHPVPPSGYDVTITSNAGSDATLYIDGTNYGNSSGAHYLKTGSHTVILYADGYEDFYTTISVDKNNTWFNFTMTEKGADAQYLEGCAYYNDGKAAGRAQYYQKAVKCFHRAAERGQANAQNMLGDCYLYGYGVPQNYNEAVKWYRKAADQGNASGQYNLGSCYFDGKGVEMNYTEAVKWYRKAADQGNEDAQFNLGICYENGYGVAKDIIEAKKWYSKSFD